MLGKETGHISTISLDRVLKEIYLVRWLQHDLAKDIILYYNDDKTPDAGMFVDQLRCEQDI